MHSALPPGPGAIVEFLQDNKPQLALVLEEQGGRLRLFTLRGRETAIPAARLLPWSGPKYPPAASRAEMEDRLARHQEARLTASADIEIMEIWNLAQGELESASLEWFAGLVWDDLDPDRLAALGRALLEAKTHFKFQPPLFLIHPRETVEARLAEQETAQERRELVAAGQDFFVELWKTGTVRTPPGEAMAARLSGLIMRRIAGSGDAAEDDLWKELTRRIPEHPHQPLILAQAWGLVPPHYNFHLDQAGYDWQDDWSRGHAQEIEAILRAFQARICAPAATGLVSIDSETTKDIDDAFALTRTADGGFALTMAIACPSLDWPWESALDEAVADRASSLYLPEGVSHMLPECLGADTFSLCAGRPRPALILSLDLDPGAGIRNFTPHAGWVNLDGNTHYALVEQAIAACVEPFAGAHLLARLLREARIRRGAVVFDQPDPDFRLEGEGADLRVVRLSKPATPEAQLLVSELMILANSTVARWAVDQNLPLLYRTQNVALPPGSAGCHTRPEEIYRMARLLANATLRTSPEPHASLGVRAYASVTSPLRRYVDFLNVAQMVHLLEHGRPLLDSGRLVAGLPRWRARLEAVGRVQRSRTRYWKLLYMRQQGQDRLWPAVVVDETPSQTVFALPGEQILVRAPKRLTGEKCLPGSTRQLRLGRVDPLLNDIKVLEVREE